MRNACSLPSSDISGRQASQRRAGGSAAPARARLEAGRQVDDAWEFQLQETPCRMGVREWSHMTSCLEGSRCRSLEETLLAWLLCVSGSWVVLIGASQSAVWTQQLANLLAPGALDALRDGFLTDGSLAAEFFWKLQTSRRRLWNDAVSGCPPNEN